MKLPDDPGLRHLAKTLAHGVVGGVRSVASGGKFGPGFLSAGFAQSDAPTSALLFTFGERSAAADPSDNPANLVSMPFE